MQLKSITIENYRSIEKETLEIKEVEGSYTYAFIGINESGKSSFLEAISLKEGLKDVTAHDFHDANKPIIISFEYVFNTEELDSLKERLVQNGFPEELFSKLKIQKVLIKTTADPGSSEIKKIVEFFPSQDSLPGYALSENSIVAKDETQTQDELNIKNYLEEKFMEFIFDLSQKIIFWKSESRFLITEPINLDNFIQDQNTSIPLKNCFILAGIDDIPSEIAKTRANPADINNLQEKLGDMVTNHIKKIWPDHPVNIKFQMDNASISFLVEDEGVKYETKTTNQRSDGFRQFVSFLLTISAQSSVDQLSNSILLLDEPETHLHPKGQENLRDELIKITKGSKNNICIFATHSNYMIDKNHLDRCYMLYKEGNKKTKLNRIDGTQTTYSEVNYVVFDIPTTDYHSELYGFIEENNKEKINSLAKDKSWKNKKTDKEEKVSLPTYIRHSIHHPENNLNKKFSQKELNDSIKILRKLKY